MYRLIVLNIGGVISSSMAADIVVAGLLLLLLWCLKMITAIRNQFLRLFHGLSTYLLQFQLLIFGN